MYEKLMYKVESRNNKVLFRLQDFTKNDNVDIDKFEEGENSKGDKRLQCKVIVMHPEELEKLQSEHSSMNAYVEELHEKIEELNNEIMQKNVEIKRLENEVAQHKRENIDERAQLQGEKFNMLVEHQSEVDELRETHINQLHTIDEEHQKYIEKISAQYNTRLDKANEKLDNEVQANKQLNEKIIDLNEGLANIKQEHIVEVKDLEKKHRDDVDEMRTKFLKLLASEHAQDLSDFNDCGELPFIVKPFARGFLKNFNEFKKRKELNTPQKIVESYELAPARDE